MGSSSKLWPRLRLGALAAALCGCVASAQAQTPSAPYPSRPVKLVVGFAPGGGNDIIARVVGEKLNQAMGQPFVVENKPGAGGMLAASFVASQPADGYTLLVGASGAMAIGPAVYTQMPYETLRDFAPVSVLGTFPLVLLVSAESPHKTVSDLVEWTKANPDKANYASSSPTFTLATELLKLKTGAKLTRVSYRGSNDSILAVLSNQTTATIVDTGPAMSLVSEGKLRALAVTSAARIPELPNVPTMAEAGVASADALIWIGLFAPKATPPEILGRLEGEIRRVMQDPHVLERFRTLATNAVSSSQAEFAARIKGDIEFWAQVGKDAGVKIDP